MLARILVFRLEFDPASVMQMTLAEMRFWYDQGVLWQKEAKPR